MFRTDRSSITSSLAAPAHALCVVYLSGDEMIACIITVLVPRFTPTPTSHTQFVGSVHPSSYSIRPLPSCKICRLLPSLNIQHIHPCAKTIKPQFTGYAFKIQTIQAGTTVVRSFRCQLLLHAALTSALLCGASLCILLSTLNIYLVCPQALMHACMHVTLRPPCR
jgi:hypothetical protein